MYKGATVAPLCYIWCAGGHGVNLVARLRVFYPPCPPPPTPMDSQLYAALIALGITVVGALGALVTALMERIKRDLARNTRLTQETREGVQDAVERLAVARNTILGLREVVRERDDRIAYIVARHPEVQDTLARYRNRRTTRATETDEHQALQRVLDDVDDPTGTDAGAYPRG